MAFNISFLPPIISSEIASFFSIILILMALFMYYQLSSESGNPLTHDRRSSTIILIIGLPLIIYLSTRLLFLLQNPDTVTRERWDLSWSFMDLKNTFEINAWPIEPDFPEDTRVAVPLRRYIELRKSNSTEYHSLYHSWRNYRSHKTFKQ